MHTDTVNTFYTLYKGVHKLPEHIAQDPNTYFYRYAVFSAIETYTRIPAKEVRGINYHSEFEAAYIANPTPETLTYLKLCGIDFIKVDPGSTRHRTYCILCTRRMHEGYSLGI